MNASSTASLSIDEYVCRKVAADLYANVIQYLGIVLALPLHIFIVILLFVRVFKRRFYHFLIMTQSIIDIVQAACIFVTQTVCIVFKKVIDNYIYNYTPTAQLVLSVYLMVYWKSAIRPQKTLDVLLCVIAAISTVELIAARIFRQQSESSNYALLFTLINTFANVALSAVCFISFYLVMRMDVSQFSEITVRGQKKMTTALLLQFILVIITNIFDTLFSYANYAVIVNPYVIEANIKVKNVTDPNLLQQYKQELMENTSLLRVTIENLEMITTLWSTFLPFLRGLVILSAIRPLLKKKKDRSVSQWSTDA